MYHRKLVKEMVSDMLSVSAACSKSSWSESILFYEARALRVRLASLCSAGAAASTRCTALVSQGSKLSDSLDVQDLRDR